MGDMGRMLDVICLEIDKIADKGLNTGNLETAYKLIDMYKDLKHVEYEEMDMDEGYSGYSGTYSGARRRDSRGRYTGSRYNSSDDYSMGRMRGMDDGSASYRMYMQSKEQYRGTKNNSNKQVLLDSVDQYMADMSDKLEMMMQDADTMEERQTIQKYLNKLRR